MQTHSHAMLVALGRSQRGYQGDKRCLWCDNGKKRHAKLYEASQNHISRTSKFVTSMLVSFMITAGSVVGSSVFGRL